MSGLKRLNPTPRFWDQTPLEPGVSLEPRLVARRWVRQRKVFWGVLARCAHSFSQRTLATGTEKMPLCIPAGQAVTSIRGNLESSGSSHKGSHSRRGGKSPLRPRPRIAKSDRDDRDRRRVVEGSRWPFPASRTSATHRRYIASVLGFFRGACSMTNLSSKRGNVFGSSTAPSASSFVPYSRSVSY